MFSYFSNKVVICIKDKVNWQFSANQRDIVFIFLFVYKLDKHLSYVFAYASIIIDGEW